MTDRTTVDYAANPDHRINKTDDLRAAGVAIILNSRNVIHKNLNKPGIDCSSKNEGKTENLQYVGFDNCNLQNGNFSGVELLGMTAKRTDLSGSNFVGGDLSLCDLDNVGLKSADLSGIGLMRSKMTKVDLTEANLSNAFASEATFDACDFSRANLSGTNLKGARFLNSCNLKGAIANEDTRLFPEKSSWASEADYDKDKAEFSQRFRVTLGLKDFVEQYSEGQQQYFGAMRDKMNAPIKGTSKGSLEARDRIERARYDSDPRNFMRYV